MVDNDVISEAGLLEIMNAQPFAETRNDATRVWQLFGERVHVGDAIKAILAIAGHAELKQQLAAAREALQAAEADSKALHNARTHLPTKVETTHMNGMTPEELAAFDSGYNAALDRAHLLLMASLAPANEWLDLSARHLLGAGDAAIRLASAEAQVKAARDLADEWDALARSEGFGGGAAKAHDLNRAMNEALATLQRDRQP